MRLDPLRLCAALLILLNTTVFAQVSSLARIAGSVSDVDGKPVRAATITMVNRDNGNSVTTTSDDRGRFVMLGLRPGVWSFVIAAPGYASIKGDGSLRAGVDVNPPIDAILRSGSSPLGTLGNVQARDLQRDLAAADTLMGQQRWDDAIGVYRGILSKTPVLTHIHLQIAAAYRRKGDFDAAIAACNELLKREPTNEKAQVGIALALLDKGDRQAAQDALLKAAASEGTGREVLFQLGELRLEDRSYDEAITWYRKAIDADGSWGRPLYKAGLAASRKGDPAAAREFLSRVLVVDPASPEAQLAKQELDQLAR
jgi:tetratricopeptide (TPR) repeat protein